MELRFEAMLYPNLGNENSDAGHIKCSRGPHLARGSQVPHPVLQHVSIFCPSAGSAEMSPLGFTATVNSNLNVS